MLSAVVSFSIALNVSGFLEKPSKMAWQLFGLIALYVVQSTHSHADKDVLSRFIDRGDPSGGE